MLVNNKHGSAHADSSQEKVCSAGALLHCAVCELCRAIRRHKKGYFSIHFVWEMVIQLY